MDKGGAKAERRYPGPTRGILTRNHEQQLVECFDVLLAQSRHRRKWRHLGVGTASLHVTLLLTRRTNDGGTLHKDNSIPGMVNKLFLNGAVCFNENVDI